MAGGADILVTVLIPTRNRAHLLKKTLLSVTKQAMPHFEVCVIDNNPDITASTAVKQIVNEFKQDYPEIIWKHIHSEKLFAAGARNDGMEIARGKYICLLDDDDELLPDSLSLRLQHMEAEPDLALLYCASIADIYPYPIQMYRYYKYNPVKHRDGLLMMSCSCIMLNKKIFADNNLWFDESLRRMEDYDLCRRLMDAGLQVKSIPEALVQINLHPDTRLSSNNLGDNDFKDILINKWGTGITEYMNSYGEGVFIWRKCFGIKNKNYAEVRDLLAGYMSRKPSLSFKIKYALVSASPVLFLSIYHVSVMLSQFFKNKEA